MRHALPALFALGCIFSCCAYASCSIDRASSAGAYLVKTKTGLYLMAEIDVIDNQNVAREDRYGVEMRLLDGKRIKLRLAGRQGDRLAFGLPALLPVDGDFRTGRLTGDFIFLLSDKDGGLLDTYSDFLFPFRDPTNAGMGDFDEAYISPVNGAGITPDSGKNPNLIFKWNKVKGASRYRLTIYAKEALAPPKAVFSELTDSLEIDVPLKGFAQGQYSWKLEAIHEPDNDWDNTVRYTLDGNKRPFFTIK